MLNGGTDQLLELKWQHFRLPRWLQFNLPKTLHWIVFGALLALTPLYVCFMKTQPPGFMASKVFPCVASAFAFAVWVFALGGPFAATWPQWYQPVFGSIALILTTLILPVLERIFYDDTPPAA